MRIHVWYVFFIGGCIILLVVFFFFSSRRRHTRLVSDWSSDVCSSDLNVRLRRAIRELATVAEHPLYPMLFDPQTSGGLLAAIPLAEAEPCVAALRAARSEERRVGKECRSRWAP